jgi:hypothetical protein
VHLPVHTVWFWLVLGTPLLVWIGLWIAAHKLVGTIEQDRQGIHYFQIRDPEENVIEVVQEP